MPPRYRVFVGKTLFYRPKPPAYLLVFRMPWDLILSGDQKRLTALYVAPKHIRRYIHIVSRSLALSLSL